MSDNINPQVFSVLRHLPEYQEATKENCQIQRLGGLTNLVYRVGHKDQAVIVRIPGEGTEEYIDREVEIHNAKVASEAGIGPDVIWSDASSGIMISQYIENSVTMTPQLFASRRGAAARAGHALRQLHHAPKPFKFRFELFAMIEEYLNILSTKAISLPDGYADVVEEAEPIKKLFEEKPGELVPSHCDPLSENFLDDGSRMWIVDYEYSGMNDALWDLGDLSVEAGLTDEQDLEMLTAYFGQAPTEAQFSRMIIYKAMCDLLWTLWGLIQFADDNPADDFWAYSIHRFERCKALMLDASFSQHLDAI